MAAFSKSNKSSHLYITIFSIITLVFISIFAWLGLQRLNSTRIMHHIIDADVVKIEQEKIQGGAINPSFPAEMQAHLSQYIHTSHIVYSVVICAVILLGLAWYLTFMYFRRQRIIKSNEQQLEELLYYDQVSEMHTSSSTAERLPDAIKKMQLDRDNFIAELRKALTNNQFILFYQPIINPQTGKIMDVEALIRWLHPTYGILTPNVFLPLCENSDFIIPLGEWVFETACKQIKKWQNLGFKDLRISINLSTRQLIHPQLVTMIKRVLDATNLPPSSLKLEITENSLMKDINQSVKILQSIRQLGLQLSLDDFGTGYSSLQYLKQIPISNLKIDKMFINDMTTNITSLGIVESVIALGKSLGLTITAEGVENENQLHILKKMGCDFVQGYLYSRPIPAKDFKHLLATSQSILKRSHDYLSKPQHYKYDVLKAEYADQAINVIANAFCDFEPMTKYLGITHAEFLPFAKLFVDKAIKDGLSIVALDHNKVVACTVVEDMADPLSITIDIDPRFKIIFSLLETLGNDFFSERSLDKGHIAHLFITAVDKDYHGQGLSRKINFESIRLAKEKQFDFMCCEFTHDYNEKGTVKNLKNSRLLLRTCKYNEFVFEGKKPFENLEGTASAYIWELREGAQLKYQMSVGE